MIILTEGRKTLYTLNGSPINRSKVGVGKLIGGKVYVHKDYVSKVVPSTIYSSALDLLNEYEPNFKFNTIMFDLNDIAKVRFDESADFDIAREPCPGRQISVDTLYNVTFKDRIEKQIFHHKWLWVDDDYRGFNVEESYEWSKTWLRYITHPSGRKDIWEQQLRNAGLE